MSDRQDQVILGVCHSPLVGNNTTLIELKNNLDFFDFATKGRQVNLNWYENITQCE